MADSAPHRVARIGKFHHFAVDEISRHGMQKSKEDIISVDLPAPFFAEAGNVFDRAQRETDVSLRKRAELLRVYRAVQVA